MLVIPALATCIVPAVPGAGRAESKSSPVFLVSTAGLEAPAIETGERVFKPAALVPIDDGDPTLGEAAGFFVTLAASEPQSVRFRLIDQQSHGVSELVRLAPPATESERARAAEPRPFTTSASETLAGGAGVYWLDSSNEAGSGLESRFGLLVPAELLSPFTRLDAFASTADDGTPLGAARLELVRDFFYLVVLGDSVMWGNGLEEQDKFSTLVAQSIEHEAQRKVVMQRYAQSGARIVPAPTDGICALGCSGEVPTVSTSITVQADLIQRADLVDLILLDGCINDISVSTIIDPQTSAEQLTALAQHFCDEEMAGLLRKLRRLAPQARIVVTGYYQMVGPTSDILALQTWSTANDVPPLEGGETLRSVLIDHSIIFRDVANQSLRAAIEQVNQEAGPAIAFADPGFTPEHAIFTPGEWLWSLTSESQVLGGTDFGLQLFPEDPLERLRLKMCLEPSFIDSAISCVYASVGHPNPIGAMAYADAIVASLRTLGVLPAASPQ